MTAVQLPLGIQLRDSSVFASFYPGRNRPTVDALLALHAQMPPRVVWLHGAAGAGKSHLLQALCARATQRGERAAFVPLRALAQAGVDVLVGLGAMPWVCLDDVDQVLGHSPWERALFALHQELEEQGGRLVLSAGHAPQAIAIQLADLASRLRGGLVLRVQSLDEEEQVAALKLRAELRGLELNDEVAQYLLRRLPREMGALCEFLDRLDQAAMIAQRRLTIPFVKQVWEDERQSPEPPAGRETRK